MSARPAQLIARLERRLGAPRAAVLADAGRRARSRGERVFLVGGVVRDLLLGRALSDVDLVVEGDAARLARALARRHRADCRVHGTFGTAVLRFSDGWRLDLARARRERYPRPAALPQVAPGDLGSDLLRRDFTVNAMALELEPAARGRLIDPVGGRDDLRRGLVRALHERSFVDDPTRAFRAVRFASRLGFRVEAATARWIRAAVSDGLVDRLSAARLRREMEQLFAEPDWRDAARRMGRFRLWPALHPALRPARGAVEALARLESRALWYDGLEESETIAGWVCVVAWLARDLSSEQRQDLVGRLRPPRRAARELLHAARDATQIVEGLRAVGRLRPGVVHRVCRGRTVCGQLLALVVSRPGRLRRALEAELTTGRRARPDIDGRDLLRAGVSAGPGVAQGLRAALEAKLDGRAATREQQLAAALRAVREA